MASSIIVQERLDYPFHSCAHSESQLVAGFGTGSIGPLSDRKDYDLTVDSGTNVWTLIESDVFKSIN